MAVLGEESKTTRTVVNGRERGTSGVQSLRGVNEGRMEARDLVRGAKRRIRTSVAFWSPKVDTELGAVRYKRGGSPAPEVE